MGWLKEKYTKEYYICEDEQGRKLLYGVYGSEYWKKGEVYPEAKILLDSIDLKDATILDIGFGRGETIKHCILNGAKEVIGVDFSEAAIEIAHMTLKDLQRSKYRLYCQDILTFVNSKSPTKNFTHILMFDVIEHIPRSEVEILIADFYKMLLPGGSIIIHTPFYNEDNDVIMEGIKTSCQDSSDQHEETKGMHINRYSAEGLKKQMEKHGFVQWSRYIFIKPKGKFPIWKYHGLMRSFIARKLNYWV